MFKVNVKDTRTTPAYFAPCSSVSIVNFEQVNDGWDKSKLPPRSGSSLKAVELHP